MRRVIQSTAVAGLIALARTADIIYVTDLEIWTMLAPCAASVIDYDISNQGYYTRCPTDDAGLQSCVCSSKPVYNMVNSSLSSDVYSSCGEKYASADQTSVASVFSQYCSQGRTTITFPTPTGKSVVNAYITDLSQIAYLAPCAQSAVEDVVMGNFADRCPSDASLYAPCICTKVYDQMTANLASSAKVSCSNGEDASLASVFVDEYCNMNKGTTSFAVPKGPPGDMTYYITGMPQFNSLNTCVQSGIADAYFEQTQYLCPNGPQALASCACIKSGMSRQVSSSLTSSVKAYCESTATDEVSSAMSLWDLYCSAASGSTKINAAAIATATDLDATGSGGPAATTGSGGGNDGADSTAGSGNGGGSGSDGGSGGGSDSSGSGSGSNKKSGGGLSKGATIAIAVLASIVGIAVIGLIGWVIRRRARKAKSAAAAASTTGSGSTDGPSQDGDTAGKPELAGSEGTGMFTAGRLPEKSELPSPQATSPSPTSRGVNTASPISPQSGAQELYSPQGGQPQPQGYGNQSAWGPPEGQRYEMA